VDAAGSSGKWVRIHKITRRQDMQGSNLHRQHRNYFSNKFSWKLQDIL